jgi:hypothetical protein
MIIKGIVDWNINRNNIGFNGNSEIEMLEEELYELKEAVVGFRYDDDEKEVYMVEEEQLHETIDALCDIVVVAIGAIHKLGINPELAMLEVIKEISSRQQDPLQEVSWRMEGPDGKWKKDQNQDPTTLYKANYQNATYKQPKSHREELEELREDLLNG